MNRSIGGVCFGSSASDGWQNGNHDKLDQFGNPAGSTDAQHLTAIETMLFWITDNGFPGGIPWLYCQDLNFDGWCGANRTGEAEAGSTNQLCQGEHIEGSFGCELRSEPYVEFCQQISIRSGLQGPRSGSSRLPGGSPSGVSLPFAGTWADPAATPQGNWALDWAVILLAASPASGNSISDDLGLETNECGSTSNGWGMGGLVSHW